MNNTQKGLTAALIIVVILLVIGFAFYHPKNTALIGSNTETGSSTATSTADEASATSTVIKKPSSPRQSVSIPAPLTVTQISNVAPTIASIQPSTIHISNTLNVYGKGFENLGPSSEVQVKITDLNTPSTLGGFVWSGKPILDTYVSFNLQPKYCAGITTLPCTPETPVAPGNYSLQVRLENGIYSNAVDFTVVK